VTRQAYPFPDYGYIATVFSLSPNSTSKKRISRFFLLRAKDKYKKKETNNIFLRKRGVPMILFCNIARRYGVWQ
jgi:hypothetical protein